MPGARSRVRPLSAGDTSDSSTSDEVSQLELHLQRQLEEDVARIFDESIYSDLEVVCGKLKILTHSCILRARTHKFYHKLEAILNVNIGRNTFDEIYSFISDAYTECKIDQQENDILQYINENLNLGKTIAVKTFSQKNKYDTQEELELYSTPNSGSPDGNNFQVKSSSPSKELNKDYYAITPIDGNILDKELEEQDALSNAFQCINKTYTDINGKQNKQCVKPTSLFINSSRPFNINKNLSSCDSIILGDSDWRNIEGIKKFDTDENKINYATSHIRKSLKKNTEIVEIYKNFPLSETVEKVLEPVYSPDSLITDDPSSSSDYLSAAYASPSAMSSNGFSHMNVEENAAKVDFVNISDSGLENTGMPESLTSNKDVTLTDVSLTESTFHDIIHDNDDLNWQDSGGSNNHVTHKFECSTSLQSPSFVGCIATKEKTSVKSSLTEICGTSTKDEKQRQNEEIVNMESSSLSSETGSWESVFPPKVPEKEACEKFISSERFYAHADSLNKPNETLNIQAEAHDDRCPSLVQKSPFKSTYCFIDAASLVDESDTVLTVHTETNKANMATTSGNILPNSSQPLPCGNKRDLSPNDWSESNDNEDSLEQAANNDPDSVQNDISPTIFEMTPVTEDTLDADTFENTAQEEIKNVNIRCIEPSTSGNYLKNLASNTPHNSIISVSGGDLPKLNPISYLPGDFVRLRKSCDSPILSGGVSVEDHLPQPGRSHSESPTVRRKIENIPIVSGAYIPKAEPVVVPEKLHKDTSNSYWVVDMSFTAKSDVNDGNVKTNKTMSDKSVMALKSSITNSENCKSRASVDSDSSDRSTHKFYIDLSTLPDSTPEKPVINDNNEKKNIFSMFIDLGEKTTTVKEMPTRLSSSLNTKKPCKSENQSTTAKSPKTKNPSLTCVPVDNCSMFEKLESMCNDHRLSISEIISNPDSQNEDSESLRISNDFINKETIQDIQKPDADLKHNLFVKLSDLDKRTPKLEPESVKINCQDRMSRSIPDNDWGESSQTLNTRCTDIISSFHSENALSLNRLFPHLKNDFSKSMPGSLSTGLRSPMRNGVFSLNIEEQGSDIISAPSSAHSSYCRSVMDNSTTEEGDQTWSLISHCQSRLGQDLLRMFLEEIAPDVIVQAGGKRIKAHKCILSSRCQYFAGILSGGWVESSGNVIILPSFSYNVVHFVLCHIYSGISVIPESISIVELATITAMLRLEGLKEAIMYTLKAKYCHHFHKPCTVCLAGVLECLPLTSVYGLDELYRKCLRWITKHFRKVWPTKAFATLPTDLLERCLQDHIINFTTENIIDTICNCGLTIASLPRSRWSDTVMVLCRRLENACVHFVAERLGEVVRALGERLDELPTPASAMLDDCLVAAVMRATPDEKCRLYSYVYALPRDNLPYPAPDVVSATPGAGDLTLLSRRASSLRRHCLHSLDRAAPFAVEEQAFESLPAELNQRLRRLGCATYGSLMAPPRHQPVPASRSDIDRVRASFVPYSQRPPIRLNTTHAKVAKSMPVIKTTKAQEKRAKHNLVKSQSHVTTTSKTPARTAYEKTKARYLQPRLPKEKTIPSKVQLKLISSTESSRNSSPSQARAGLGSRPATSRELRETSHRTRETLRGSYEISSFSETRLRKQTCDTTQSPRDALRTSRLAPQTINDATTVRVTSQIVRVTSLTALDTSQKGRDTSQIRRAPRETPRRAGDSSQQARESPRQARESPRQARESPRQARESPRQARDSSRLSRDTPRVRRDSPSTSISRPHTVNITTRDIKPQSPREFVRVARDAPRSPRIAPRPREFPISVPTYHHHAAEDNKYATYTKKPVNINSATDAVQELTKRTKTKIPVYTKMQRTATRAKTDNKNGDRKEIPVMERSGTFLKEGPTFEETKNNDVDE